MCSGNGFAWFGSLVTIVAFATAGLFARSPKDDERTVRRALALLPGRAPVVSIIDAQDAKPDVRETLLKLDAFITRGESVVYVVKQSEVLRAATKGARLCDYMLASIIWHEIAHIKGADETAARRAEQEMWTRFDRDGVVDQLTGMRYLQVLANRTDDQLKASRLGSQCDPRVALVGGDIDSAFDAMATLGRPASAAPMARCFVRRLAGRSPRA